jgi:hypothetical protein
MRLVEPPAFSTRKGTGGKGMRIFSCRVGVVLMIIPGGKAE